MIARAYASGQIQLLPPSIMTALWRDAARLCTLAFIWLVMVGSYWKNPAPASLAGIALPKDVGRWLNRGALCREVAGRCAKGDNCGDGVNERCGRAASAAVLRASCGAAATTTA